MLPQKVNLSLKYLILLLFFLLPFLTDKFDVVNTYLLHITSILLFTLLGVWFVLKGKIYYEHSLFTVFGVIFLGIAFYSCFHAVYFYKAIWCFFILLNLSFIWYVFRVKIHELEREINRVILAIALFEALFGLLQVLFKFSPRPQGTFLNYNYFGLFLLIALLILLGEKIKWQIKLTGSLIFLFPIFLTFSRTNFLLLGLLGFAFMIQFLQKKWTFLLGSILIILLISLFIFSYPRAYDRFAYSRLNIWQGSLRMFSEHPLQGVGLGMYEYYSGLYQKSEKSIAKFGKLARTAHNQFLHLGAELGSFGLGAYLIFLVLILRKLKKSKKSFYIKAALSAIILFSFFHNILFHLPTAVMGIYLSILLTEDVECRSKSFPVKKRFILYPLLLGGLMLFSLTKPMAAFFFFRKGVNYEEQGDVRKAKVFYQKALRWDKRCSEYWGEFGEFCFDIYKLTQQLLWLIEAERNYAVALSLSPRNASYFSRWGMICFELYIKRRSQAFLNKATFCFTQAQKLIPTNAFYYFNLALTARAKGEIRKAKELLKRALQLEPNFIGAYGFLSALTRKDNPKQALKYSRKAEIRLKNITNKPISEYERALLRPYGSSEKDKN